MGFFKRMLIISVLAVGLFTIVSPASVSAAKAENCGTSSGGLLGFPTWYKYLEPSWDATKGCTIKADIGGDPSVLGKILLAVFEIMLRVGGIVAVIFVLYGSIQYLISQGEPENLKNARTTIINALIGLIITMFATGIVNLIGGRIT